MNLKVVMSLIVVLTVSLMLSGCMSCSAPKNPDQLREQTAAATARVKENTKAVAEGIRDGLKSDKPLDLNTASKAQLSGLSGIDSHKADLIIEHRPYSSKRALLEKHVLAQDEYDKIAGDVVVK